MPLKDVLIAMGVWERLPLPVQAGIERRGEPSEAEVLAAPPPEEAESEDGSEDLAAAAEALRVVLEGGPGDRRPLPDAMPGVARFIAERRAALPHDRGIAEGELVSLLARIRHPQTAAVAERILEDLLAPLPRRSTDRPEELAMRALVEFMDGAREVLASLPLSPRGRDLLEHARTRRTAADSARLTDETAERLGRVDEVFYGPRPPEEGLLALLERGELPALGAGTEQPAAPALGEAPSLEIALREGGGALARGTLAADPQTGLAVVHLGGGLAIPVWRALASPSAAAVQGGRWDWERQAATTHLGATMAELHRLDAERRAAGATALVPRPRDQALAESRLEELRGADSVQMMLGGKAGEDVRARLVEALRGAISLERGLAMLELALGRERRAASIRLTNVEDAARFLPNITAVEVAILSLLDRVPPLLIEQDGLTMIYGMTPAGVEWASDVYDPTTERQGLHPLDPYVYLGVTEMHGGTNFSYFREAVRDLLFGILRSGLTDRFFFDHLWTAHPDAATVGLNHLRAVADPRVLLDKEVIDLGTQRAFGAAEIAKLIGLLERVPGILVRPGAARIYFKPFAAGILFADHDGRPVDYVPYHPYLRSEAFQEVHYKVEQDATDSNPLMRQLLGGDVFSTFMAAAFEGTDGELSPLEREALEVSERYGIFLPLAMRVSVDHVGFDDILSVSDTSLKMGRDEITAVDGVLSRLPRHLLALARDGREGQGGIRVIRKKVAPEPNMMTMRVADGRLGLYDHIERTITLYHFQEQPHRMLSPKEQQIWRDTLAHEIGEAVFFTLRGEEAADFLSIYPWRLKHGLSRGRIAMTADEAFHISFSHDVTPDMTDEEIRVHFLTSYSTSEPHDLFAEAFAAYVFHGPEFRRRAEASPYLKHLYDWMAAHVFADESGMTFSYTDEAATSLAEIEGIVSRWRADVAERKRDLERDLAARAEGAKGAIAGVVVSVEGARDWESDEEEAAYRKEQGEGFARAYYSVAREDEATRRARRFEELRELGVPPDIVSALEAMATFIAGEVAFDEPEIVFGIGDGKDDSSSIGDEEDVDEDVDEEGDDDGPYFSEVDAPAGGDFAERMATAAWDAMGRRGNRPSDVREALQEWVGRYARMTGIEVATSIDDDFVAQLIEDAAVAIAGTEPDLVDISRTISGFLLPGQYGGEDLQRVHGMMFDRELSALQSMGRVFRFFAGDERFDLSREEVAEMTAALFSRSLMEYEYLHGDAAARLIVALEDDGATIQGVARAMKIPEGAVDAFAEAFLLPADYAALRGRSQTEGGGSGRGGGGSPPASPAPSGPSSPAPAPSGASGAGTSSARVAFGGVIVVHGGEEPTAEMVDEAIGGGAPSELGVFPADVAISSGALFVSSVPAPSAVR